MHLYISLSVKIIFYHGKSRVLEAVSDFRGPIIDSILWYQQGGSFYFYKIDGGCTPRTRGQRPTRQIPTVTPHVRREWAIWSSFVDSYTYVRRFILHSSSPSAQQQHTPGMTEPMDIDTPTSGPASGAQPRNAMAALMANAKGKGKEIASPAADGKAVDDKEGLPWYVLLPSFLRLLGC